MTASHGGSKSHYAELMRNVERGPRLFRDNRARGHNRAPSG